MIIIIIEQKRHAPDWTWGRLLKNKTHADAIRVRLPNLAKVDADAGAALGAEHLVLGLGVEAIIRAALAAAVVPRHVRRRRVYEQVAEARARRAVALEHLVAGLRGSGQQGRRQRHAELDVAAVATALVRLAGLVIAGRGVGGGGHAGVCRSCMSMVEVLLCR